MIEEEQKELADYIKSVHLSLRCKSRQMGAEVAWKQHVENEEVLRNYARCMKTLAENYWSVRNNVDKEQNLCRLQWMINTVKQYFENNGLLDEVSKEEKKLQNFASKCLLSEKDFKNFNFSRQIIFTKPYTLLDVGSCYDPFSRYDSFRTFPIDLCPAIPSVKRCDFTQTRVEDTATADWFQDGLKTFPRNFFDIVIFSLFLEYLPSPEQRYSSCEKAYETLKVNGLLLIATPDSKHESANAGLMKTWKIALARIGFVRIKMEKLKYIYCMAFRKAYSQKYPQVLYNIENFSEEKAIKIPQDFVDYETDNTFTQTFPVSEESVREGFEELPFA